MCRSSTTSPISPDGRIRNVAPNRRGVPFRVTKYTLEDLDAWPYPKAPMVPLAETVHERYSAEIFRGCTRGCRFCQAGMVSRPVRERSIDTIGAMVEAGLRNTGLQEVGLLSLSSADHSEIGPITHELAERYAGTNVSLSLPSTRVDAFNIELAEELVPQRTPQRPHVRPRGRQRAHAPSHQQDGHRRRPDHDRRGRVQPRLAEPQALLHVRAAHRDRRGRARHRRPGGACHRDRTQGRRPRDIAARSPSARSSPSRTLPSSGLRRPIRRSPTTGCASSNSGYATIAPAGEPSRSASRTATPA